MGTLSEYADALVEEGLAEAADTFFGKRKRLEDEIALFHKKCRELERVGREVVARGHGLGFLLLEGEGVAGFYRALGLEWDKDSPLSGSRPRQDMAPGPGLLGRTRYWKTVYGAYRELHDALDVYQHGRHYNDPARPGGKKRTICLMTIIDWGERINKRIESVNRDNQASQVLQFAKQFRNDEVEKEKITGAGLVYNLDGELAFSPIDLLQCGFFDFPDLPGPSAVKNVIKTFCRGLYKDHKERILGILERVEKQ
ncbi:hypothetical protein [Desulfoplanes sp.]